MGAELAVSTIMGFLVGEAVFVSRYALLYSCELTMAGKHNRVMTGCTAELCNLSCKGRVCLLAGSGEMDSKYRIVGIVWTMVFAVPATAQSGTLVILPPIS